MADRKATNKYYPPDWDPKKGSLNQYQGQHPLRDRARKLNQGILIVRFEMPFPIICSGCEANIGMGVRYNAEKKRAGNYFSTPIWQFTMKCHLCPNKIVIQTDPKNAEYSVIQGAVKRTMIWDPKDSETIEIKDIKTIPKPENPFNKLEHKTKDVNKGLEAASRLMELQSLNQKQWEDPYTQSQKLRSIFRKGRKEREEAEERTNQLKDKYSLFIDLEPELEEDEIEAQKKHFKRENNQLEKLENSKKQSLTSNLFKNSKQSKHCSSNEHLENLKNQLNRKTDPFLNNSPLTKNTKSSILIKKISKHTQKSNLKLVKSSASSLVNFQSYSSDSDSATE